MFTYGTSTLKTKYTSVDAIDNFIMSVKASDIVFDPVRNVIYLADSDFGGECSFCKLGSRIFKIYYNSDNILVMQRIAGSGISGYKESDDPLQVQFYQPQGIDLDSDGNLIVADTFNHRIRKVIFNQDGSVNNVVTIAGSGTTEPNFGSPWEGTENNFNDCVSGAALSTAKFCRPYDVAVDSQDNIYVADTFNKRVRKITTDGEVTTVVIGPNMSTKSYYPKMVYVDKRDDTVYFSADNGTRLYKVNPPAAPVIISNFGSSSNNVLSPNGIALYRVSDLHVNDDKSLIISTNENSQMIWRWDYNVSRPDVIAGRQGGNPTLIDDAEDGTKATFYGADSVTRINENEFFVLDSAHGVIRKVFRVYKSMNIKIYKGWNLIGIPYDDTPMSSVDYIDIVGHNPDRLAYKITKVTNFDLIEDAFNAVNSIITEIQIIQNSVVKTHVVGFGGEIDGIDADNGFFVRTKSIFPVDGVDVLMRGVDWSERHIPLSKGENWINLPTKKYTNVVNLVNSSNVITEAQRYDRVFQMTKSYIKGFGGDDFGALVGGEGFVIMTNDVDTHGILFDGIGW